jgi:23S rRNA (uracil1939-C5)-methyltransferase
MTDESIEVTVRALASGGDGVADLPDGRVIFVPRTAPGDRALVRIEKSKQRWARGSVERVLEPGADRVDAPCPLYDACGGCQLQHLPYEVQTAWKGRFVADALERIGGLSGVSPPDVVPSPKPFNYRNRISFTLRRLRGGRVVAGFHALNRPAHVIEVRDECLLPDPGLLSAWTALRGGWGAGARLLPDAGRLQLTLRLEADGVALMVDGGSEGWRGDLLVEAVSGLSSVWHTRAGTDSPTLVGGTSAGGVPPAFRQVNEEAFDLLRAHVLETVEATFGDDVAPTDPSHETAPRAIDAYCGTGVFGRALARRGWHVSGIEADPAAVAAARTEAPDGFDARLGRVEDLLSDLLPARLLLVNPPRTGLGAVLPRMILDRPPAVVVYVSCDPATLARDLGVLAARFELTELSAFDLFPQTAHVETVAVLRLRGEAA